MRYLDITSPDINNGLGCRVTLWTSGCSHHCPGCQNPETWSFESGKEWDQSAKSELLEKLSKPYIKGLTLSGGDPMYSEKDLIPVLKEIKEKFPEKDIWLYTGFELEQIKDHEILNYIDVLVDGQYIENLRDISLAFRGSSNQIIWEKSDNSEWVKSKLNKNENRRFD